MSSIKDEKALLRQQIDANRTVMRLELALASHEYRERLGKLKSAAKLGSRLSAVFGGLRTLLGLIRGGEKRSGRWGLLLRLGALIPAGFAIGRYLRRRRAADANPPAQ